MEEKLKINGEDNNLRNVRLKIGNDNGLDEIIYKKVGRRVYSFKDIEEIDGKKNKLYGNEN